jgi:DNA-binding NtrC family response regulator
MSRLQDLSVLLVDDEPAWIHGLAIALERSMGIKSIYSCNDSREVLPLLGEKQIDLMLLDITMPHITGDELLPQILAAHPDLPVIILTGINQVELSVRCMKLGAFDFFVKNIEQGQLLAGITRAFKMLSLQQENRQLNDSFQRPQLKQPEAFSEIVSAAPQILSLCRYLEAVAPGPHPVLISGESGTGKELFARAVHRLSRPTGPWIALNVAGLDDNVFSDTLFGHLRGAFTGADRVRPGMVEAAAGGTLFLDEIGDLSPGSQVKLLRLLQEGEYLPLGADKPRRAEIRVVVATNCALESAMNKGSFRRDLFYRLAAHRVELPPLRERAEDIPLLLDYLLAKEAAQLGIKTPAYPRELPLLLTTYAFPGNIRELAAMISDALGTHVKGTLSMRTFRALIQPRVDSLGPLKQQRTVSFGDQLPTLQEVGELLVAEALERAAGNQTLAASMLGISRPALSKRLKKSQS